mmetsp:Transcript_23092/g.54484  ORF Transcript_23092/g.54484 Transcript_23092/m.54484 type:complete len:86 (+) Transcript_23092:118-375(+)
MNARFLLHIPHDAFGPGKDARTREMPTSQKKRATLPCRNGEKPTPLPPSIYWTNPRPSHGVHPLSTSCPSVPEWFRSSSSVPSAS